MSERILLIGPQGAGKSTQGKLLADYLQVPYISTGDIFRGLSKDNSEEGRRIRQIISSGNLVDDKTTSEVIERKMKEGEFQDGFIMDGYPRTLEQIEFFDPGFNRVFYLELSDEEAAKRLLERGRDDDTPELIAQRLRLYHEQTNPILDYYKSKGLLREINGARDIDDIQKDLRVLFG